MIHRVTLLEPKQLDMFGEPGGFAGPLRELCSIVYDPTVTLFQEALESCAIPEVVEVVQQSYYLGGDMWWWDKAAKGLVCRRYVARITKEELGL